MYCISDAEYLRDFTMMLNDDIIDCFTQKPEFTDEEIVEILETETSSIVETTNAPNHHAKNEFLFRI